MTRGERDERLRVCTQVYECNWARARVCVCVCRTTDRTVRARATVTRGNYRRSCNVRACSYRVTTIYNYTHRRTDRYQRPRVISRTRKMLPPIGTPPLAPMQLQQLQPPPPPFVGYRLCSSLGFRPRPRYTAVFLAR